MNEEILRALVSVRSWRRGGERAPHKPLLLLLAVGRLMRGDDRLVLFSEFDAPLRKLLIDFGPTRRSQHPEYPFVRLANDGIWELHGAEGARTRKGSTDIARSELLNRGINGGFTAEIAEALAAAPRLLERVVSSLLDANFPESIHEDLLQAVGIEFGGTSVQHGKRRDPEFRDRVLTAYEHQCAVCGFNVRVGRSPIALEAAHIRWHQAGGPDSEENGIALCSLHHKLFDRGAFTLDSKLRVKVSDRAHGTQGFSEWLMAYHGQQVRAPQRRSYYPDDSHVSWHVREVFQGTERESTYR